MKMLTMLFCREHLYRRHTLPPLCTRCCGTFKSDSELKEHSRLPIPCEIQNTDPPEGFDKSQEKLLRSRKKGLFGDTKEDQWREMYLILFPDTLPTEIPSPCTYLPRNFQFIVSERKSNAMADYDYDEELDQQPDPSPRSAAFAQYEAYLSRELPRNVLQELEVAMERELGPIEERLKSKLETIVRSCQERLFRTYQETFQPGVEGEQQPDVVSRGDVGTEAGPSTAHHHPGGNLTSYLPFFDELAAYQIPSEMPVEMWNNFTGFSIGGGVPSDSAYSSLGDVPELNGSMMLGTCSNSWIVPSTDDQIAAETCPVQGYSFGECTMSDGDRIRIQNVGKGKGKARVDDDI